MTAIAFLALLVFCLIKWLFDDVYGLNDTGSLIYMGSLYVAAFAIYAVSRLVRRRQGIDMTMVHKEIPPSSRREAQRPRGAAAAPASPS